MTKDFIGYETLTDKALRSVVREALRQVQAKGLVGGHHFYLTFKTRHPGVGMPDFLKERYPDEITIVLQKQFWGLQVDDDSFDVTLTFQKVPATLHVPFAALTGFADPGVQFGLQFRGAKGTTDAAQSPAAVLPSEPASPTPAKTNGEAKPAAESQIVSLDKFRKK